MKSVVLLCSGGIDSSVIIYLCKKESIEINPIFIDYGQLAKVREWKSCRLQCKRAKIKKPVLINLSGYGSVIKSGLTRKNLRIREDAFLPGRNHLFLLTAAGYAFQTNSDSVAIGLLSEEHHIFPDQTEKFTAMAEGLIAESMGRKIRVVAPLAHMNKAQVLRVAEQLGIRNTYSCHAGESAPCGKCISCLEIKSSNPK